MPPAPTLEYLLDAVRAYFAATLPHCLPDELRVVYFDRTVRRQLVHPIPPALRPVAVATPAADSLRERILEVLEVEPLKTSTVARRLGAKYNGHFRNVIKAMRDDGEIELTAADGKYRLAGEETAPLSKGTPAATFEDVVAVVQSFASANWPGFHVETLKLLGYVGGVPQEKVLSLPTVATHPDRPL